MKNLCIMIKPASSLCNLRCRYCFYADVADLREVRSYGIMPEETMERVLSNVRADLTTGDRVTFAFQGGEPTLAGLDWFRRFTAQTQSWTDIRLSYALQTNATLIDEEWCAFLKEYDFLVGVSYDLLPGQHDDARKDADGTGTSGRVLSAIGLLNSSKVEYNILCTLTNSVALRPDKVWKQLVKYDISFVQFTPCLDTLEGTHNSYALTPQAFASFYQRIFELWYDDFTKGKYRSVKLFDDIVNLLAYGMPTACGIDGHCSPQMVVEADGSAYPCDFYCTDEYRLGSLAEQSLVNLFESPGMRSFAARPHSQPALCASCPFLRFCRGGCKRMQQAVCCRGEDTFCGYQAFLKKHMASLQNIAQEQRFRRQS